MTFLQLAMGYIVGRLLVSVLFIPAYFRGELYTSYELLQRRFGPAVKNVAAVIFLVTRTLADGVRLFATALVITVVTQVPVTWTVISLGAAMIIYTVRGGASAVIWTDVVQMFVYVAGALAVLHRAPPAASRRLERGRGQSAARRASFVIFDFSTDPRQIYTFWAGHARRRRADAGDPRHRSVSGAAAALERDVVTRGGNRPRAERRDRLRTVHALPVIGVLLYVFYQQTPLPRPLVTNDEVLPLFVVTSLHARRGRVHRRSDRGGGAVAVHQRPGSDDGERLLFEICAS